LFILEHIIDEGTFGKVKLGIHLPTKEKVAIKILEKSKIEDASDSERIHREIYFLKKLNHINIIKIYEVKLAILFR
jgi:5'-AMP-activated protein kinase catalytic alpha subunit